MHTKDARIISLAVMMSLSLGGCEFVQESTKISAEMKAKGYGTRNGQIVKVAEPTGPALKRASFFQKGDYVLQGYDEKGRAEFTDIWKIKERETLPDVMTNSSIRTLQGRMTLRGSNGRKLYSNRNCEYESIKYENYGIFTASSKCYNESNGTRVAYQYEGTAKEDGFIIDVTRTNQLSGETKDIKIISHIKTEGQETLH